LLSNTAGRLRLPYDTPARRVGHLDKESAPVKFMLMMHAPRTGWKESGLGTWPPADIRAHIAFMMRLNQDLIASGEWVDGQGLALPDEARIVRAAPASGQPVVTDGPFAEAKEFLAGFWIVDVETVERVYAIAARISAAPGKGGEPLNMPIEVRQVMSRPPEDL
jgi:hypothetical protein